MAYGHGFSALIAGSRKRVLPPLFLFSNTALELEAKHAYPFYLYTPRPIFTRNIFALASFGYSYMFFSVSLGVRVTQLLQLNM